MSALDQILQALSESGHRITEPRRVMTQRMLDMPDHFTPADLASEVHRDHPEIAESTIYRFLDTLSELDLVDHGHLAHGAAVYHVHPVPEHVHLVCNRCHQIIEAPLEEFDRLTEGLRTRFGFTPRPHHFALEGVCRDCETAPSEG